jgi:ParB-like chromosome segregation protein Spo0J
MTNETTLKLLPSYEYEIHPLAEMLPPMDDGQFDGLVGSIRREGLLEPMVLYQGKILDGRNRYRAAKEAGYKFTDRDFVQLKAGVDPKEFVYSINIQRRHLNRDQKQDLISRFLKLNPKASNRAIAKLVGVDDKTVGAVRDRLEKIKKDFRETWEAFIETEQRAFIYERRESVERLLKAGAEFPQQNALVGSEA